MGTDVTCPRTFECSGDRTSFDIGRIPSYIAITSSCFSCLGSLLIIFAYLTLKDMRTGAQKIITLLAIADFFTASGHIVGSTNYLIHFNDTNEKSCGVFETICRIQSSVSTWSSMCSYWWTCILAFYFFLVLVYNKAALAGRLIPLYNIIAWLIPLIIVIPLLATGKLGYAPYAASTWCFIRDSTYSSNATKLVDKPQTVVLVLLAGQLWQMISFILVSSVYMVIRANISKTLNRINIQMLRRVPEVGGVEKRLLAIPILFIFLRIWGTIQFFYSLGVSGTNNNGCIPKNIHLGFFILGCLEAIGDSGQGWGNAVLYIFMSPKIRTRLFCDPCQACVRVSGRKLQAVGQKLASVGAHRLEESQSASSSQSQNAGPVVGQQWMHTSRASASSRAEPSDGAGPSETSEPAPPVPISVVPGYKTIVDVSEELS